MQSAEQTIQATALPSDVTEADICPMAPYAPFVTVKVATPVMYVAVRDYSNANADSSVSPVYVLSASEPDGGSSTLPAYAITPLRSTLPTAQP